MDVSGGLLSFPSEIGKKLPANRIAHIFLDRPLVRIHVIVISSPHAAFAHVFDKAVVEVVASRLQPLTLAFRSIRLVKFYIMASDAVFVLPGDIIDPSLIPSHPKKPLRLGPGLRHVPPNDIVPTLAGQLVTDRQKNAIRVENARGKVRS
jgi:hypothetical protein